MLLPEAHDVTDDRPREATDSRSAPPCRYGRTVLACRHRPSVRVVLERRRLFGARRRVAIDLSTLDD